MYSKAYERAYHEASFTPKIDYTMPKSHDKDIDRNSDGTYTITYKIEFNLDGNNSNYALKNLEFRDYLDVKPDENRPSVAYFSMVIWFKQRPENIFRWSGCVGR